MKRVVTVGGGTGQAQLLRALAPLGPDLTAIVGVTDNGGHSGLLRRQLGIPAVGDARACLAALAPTPLLTHRFPDGASLGNLVLAALIHAEGSLSAAIQSLSSTLGVRIPILPVSDDSAQVCAELADGRVVRGEWEIILRRPRTAVRRVSHRPALRALPAALRAVRRAHAVVISPGTLLTGTVSALLPLRRAIHAPVIQVCNIMTQAGNTDGFTAADHVDALRRLAGVAPDVLVVNSRRPPDSWLAPYRREGARMVVDDADRLTGVRVVRGDFLEPAGTDISRYRRAGRGLRAGPHYIRHDPRKLARALARLIP